MLTHYLQAAMHRAIYKILDEDGTFFGEIPDLPGVFANADTLEACREELIEVLEGWILLGLHLQHHIPVLDNIDLNPRIQQEVA